MPTTPQPRAAQPLEVRRVPLSDLHLDEQNARAHGPRNMEAIRESLERFGQVEPLVVQRSSGRVVGGNGRLAAMRELGWSEAEVVELELSDAQARALGIALNRTGELANWDEAALAAALREIAQDAEGLAGVGFSREELIEALAAGEPSGGVSAAREALRTRFGVPPFSVLDTRQGYWQERRRAWLALGIASELGRGDNLLKFSAACQLQRKIAPAARRASASEPFKGGDAWAASGTIVFDPVLCELAYRWFSPPGGVVLDPFAGGSVRGVVAGILGRRYIGIDLREEQVQANGEQWEQLSARLPSGAGSAAPEAGLRASAKQRPAAAPDLKLEHAAAALPPRWLSGDSQRMDDLLPAGESADFVFSCPPYADLERYSEDPRDLSTLNWAQFSAAYRAIIAASCARLREDRFACFVVGEVRARDGEGFYRGLVSETIVAFEAAGLRFYNEAILVNSIGTLPLRAGRIFAATRKLGKTHQNVLVFCKGSARAATEAVGPVDFGAIQAEGSAAAADGDEAGGGAGGDDEDEAQG